MLINGKTGNIIDVDNVAGVVQYDRNGEQTASWLIPKSQKSIDMAYKIIHDGGAVYPTAYLTKGSQYKSFIFLAGNSKSYIYINDSPDNTEKMKKGKLERTTSSKEGEAYYIELTEKSMIPVRNSIFTNKERNNEITPALFAVSDYDRLENIYVTIKLDTKGKDKGLKLAWLQPE
jgi:hypothetical protein